MRYRFKRGRLHPTITLRLGLREAWVLRRITGNIAGLMQENGPRRYSEPIYSSLGRALTELRGFLPRDWDSLNTLMPSCLSGELTSHAFSENHPMLEVSSVSPAARPLPPALEDHPYTFSFTQTEAMNLMVFAEALTDEDAGVVRGLEHQPEVRVQIATLMRAIRDAINAPVSPIT